MLGEARIKLWPLAAPPAQATADGRSDVGPPLAPGELRVQRTSVLAGTATGPVELGDVQPPGKRRMPAADWAPRPAPGGRGAGLRWRRGAGRAAAASSLVSSRPVVTSPVVTSPVVTSPVVTSPVVTSPAGTSAAGTSAAASGAVAGRRARARSPRPAGRSAPTRPAARPMTC